MSYVIVIEKSAIYQSGCKIICEHLCGSLTDVRTYKNRSLLSAYTLSQHSRSLSNYRSVVVYIEFGSDSSPAFSNQMYSNNP